MKIRRAHPYSSPPCALLHPEDPQVVTLKLPGYKQARNYSCGFTSVLMLLRYFGCMTPGRQIFEALGTQQDGTGQNAIVRVLRSEGVRANVRYDVNFSVLRRSIAQGKVLVGYLHDEEHWLVIYGYGENPERVFVADPEPGKNCEYPWDSYGPRLANYGIVCSAKTDKGFEDNSRLVAGELAGEGSKEQLAQSPALIQAKEEGKGYPNGLGQLSLFSLLDKEGQE